MIKNLKELEQKLQQVERECREAEMEEAFRQTLRQYHGDDEVVSFRKYKELLERRKKEDFEIRTKIPTLDRIIVGFRGGELVVVSGLTGEGKTSLCQTFTRNFSQDGIRSLWFSYEVSGRDFLAKFGENLPAGYLPKTLISNKLVWIERKIVEAIVKYNIKVVFIDHLHYLIDLSKLKNTSLEIGGIVREIKKMAVKYNIVIFLIAHTTKIKFEDKPGIEAIRDSSMTAQEGDYVLMIWRDRERQSKIEMRKEGVKYTNNAILSVEKNRRSGKLGTVKLLFKNNLFLEETKKYEGFAN